MLVLLRDVSSLVRSRVCSHIPFPHILQLARRTPLPQVRGLPNLFRQGILSRDLQMKARQKTGAFIPHHKRDKVPGNFNLIYVSSLRHWINWTRLSMSVLTLTICSLSVYKLSQLAFSRESLQTLEGLFVISTPFVIIGMFVLLNFLTRPVFIRIYHNPEIRQFIGVRRTFLGRLKQLNYTLGDISLKPREKPSSKDTWDTASLNVKNTPMFLMSSDFMSTEYFSMHINGSQYPDKSTLAKERFY